nr:hypothetical protein [Mycobacteroides abscessus]
MNRNLAAGVSAVGTGTKSGLGEFVTQLDVGVVAGGEPFKGHRNVVAAFRINGHGVDLAPLELLADILVPDRHVTGSTADDGLLSHLVLQVFTAGLGLIASSGEQHAEQHPACGRGIVDVFHC